VRIGGAGASDDVRGMGHCSAFEGRAF
jgi:hypothetical protein